MTSIFEGKPQNKALSNKNTGHLGSRYIYLEMILLMEGILHQLRWSISHFDPFCIRFKKQQVVQDFFHQQFDFRPMRHMNTHEHIKKEMKHYR